jgi:hypothetical protein
MGDLFPDDSLSPDMPFDQLKHNVLDLETQIANEAYVDLDGDGRLESVIQRFDTDGDGIPDRMKALSDGQNPTPQPYDQALWESGTTVGEANHAQNAIQFSGEPCYLCSGTGVAGGQVCYTCSGTGIWPYR